MIDEHRQGQSGKIFLFCFYRSKITPLVEFLYTFWEKYFTFRPWEWGKSPPFTDRSLESSLLIIFID